MTSRWAGASGLALAVLGLLAAPADAGNPVVPSTSQLAPGLVTSARSTLYTVSWTNGSNGTLTNVVITIKLPVGSTVRSTDPGGCTVSASADAVTASCSRANMQGGDTATQQVFFQVPGTLGQSTVTASLTGNEAGNDQNKSHTDTFAAPPQTLTVVATNDNTAAGGCLQPGDAALATQPGVGTDNPITTAASLSGATGLFCAAVTLQEHHRTNPTEGCGAGVTCTVDLSVTEAPAVATPIQLTFAFVGMNKNTTWFKNGAEVADCPGATALPAGLNACVNSRSKLDAVTVSIGVLWGGGPDPSWTGK